MNKLIKFSKHIMWILLIAGFIVVVANFSNLAIAANENPCDMSNPPEYCGVDTSGQDPATSTIWKVTNIASFVAGFLAVFWIIIMGMKYQTSYGNPEKTAAARKGIIYAVVGIALVVAANLLIYVILKLVE